MRLYRHIWVALASAMLLNSCTDDDLRPGGINGGPGDNFLDSSRAMTEGLQPEETSDNEVYYVANSRVPLVGYGRMVNILAGTVVTVGALDKDFSAVIDLDLTNPLSMSDVVGADVAYNDIISIKDIAHRYKGGQNAGFVIKATQDGVLSLDVLKQMALTTYLDGVEQERYAMDQATSVLDLGLGNISSGTTDTSLPVVIEHHFEKPFNEIKLGNSGVTATVWNGVQIYYAFVGDNPIFPAITNGAPYVGSDGEISMDDSGTPFFDKCFSPYDGSYIEASREKLTDSNLGNGIEMSVISKVFQPHMSVDFGRDVPVGSEVGFYLTSGSVLNLGVGKSVLVKTYTNSKDNPSNYHDYTELERYSHTQVVKLALVGGGGQMFGISTTKEKTRRVEIGFYGLDVDLGATVVHYAYVRFPTKVDPSSYFTLMDATVFTPGYHLPSVPTNPIDGVEIIDYEYTILEAPGKAEIGTGAGQTNIKNTVQGNILWNMSVPGPYKVQITYHYKLAGDSTIHEAVQQATITRKVIPSYAKCGNALVNPADLPENRWADEGFTAYIPSGGWGATISGAGTQGDINAIVNPETNDYMGFTSYGLNLIANQAIVGVKSATELNTAREEKKVGFAIGYNNNIVEADVLKFLRVKLLNKEGGEVASGVAQDGVSVDVLNVADGNSLKMIYIKSKEPFYKIELFSTGLLDINIAKNIQVYFAFMDDAASCLNGGSMECMQMISNASYQATVEIQKEGALDLINHITDMTNIVDGRIDTYCEVGGAVKLGIGTKVFINLGEKIKGGQEVGFIISTNVKVADLIDTWEVHAYSGNEEVPYSETGNNKTSANVLDVTLDQGEYIYFSVFPAPGKDIDRLELRNVKVLNAVEYLRVVGPFLKPDYDGDGLIDCYTDNPQISVKSMSITKDRMCSDEEMPRFAINGGNPGQPYYLRFEPTDGPATVAYTEYPTITMNAATDREADGTTLKLSPLSEETNAQFGADLKPGVYYVSLCEQDNFGTIKPILNKAVRFILHDANVTIWTGSVNHDWNEWGNWTNGVPWTCTNVILPSPSKLLATDNTTGYPLLEEGYEYHCNNMHFEAGAEIIGGEFVQHQGTVFVDMALPYNQTVLASAPLQAMVTGDQFIASNKEAWNLAGSFTANANAWTGQTWNMADNSHYFVWPSPSTGYTEQRTQPAVYQRFWSRVVTNEHMSRAGFDDNVIASPITDWSRTFNNVTSAYEKAIGFVLRLTPDASGVAGSATGKEIFHYPKNFTTYNYFTKDGENVGSSSITRRGTQGNFWVNYPDKSHEFKLTRDHAAGEYFVFGNPFMATINGLNLLMNNDNISEIHVYDGVNKVYNVYNKSTISAAMDHNANLQEGEEAQEIPKFFIRPMTAVILKMTENAKEATITVPNSIMTQSIFMDASSEAAQTSSEAAMRRGALYVTASTGTSRSSCAVKLGGHDGYVDGEDATLLLPSEDVAAVEVYTIGANRALKINGTTGNEPVAIGLKLAAAGTVNLTFKADGQQWQNWQLLDQSTGRRYDLGSKVSVDAESGHGRFFLVPAGK